MKYFIVGLHGSGKHEVADILEQQGVSCGRLFSNIEEPSSDIYNVDKYDIYTTKDINDIFENEAYLFMKEIKQGIFKYYEGLSTYSLDSNQAFVLSPDQLVSIPSTFMPEDVCFIWMDNTKSNRFKRFKEENRKYNFNDREHIEYNDIDSFIKILYGNRDNKVLYFMNEDPVHIAAIIFSMIQHEDLIPIYSQAFAS